MVEGGKVGIDHRTRLANVANPRSSPEDEVVHHVFEGGAGSVERLFDAIHCCTGLRLEIVDHVLLDLITLVRMVVIDWQRGGATHLQQIADEVIE